MLHGHWHRRKWKGARVIPLALLMLTGSNQVMAQEPSTPAPVPRSAATETVIPPGPISGNLL